MWIEHKFGGECLKESGQRGKEGLNLEGTIIVKRLNFILRAEQNHRNFNLGKTGLEVESPAALW